MNIANEWLLAYLALGVFVGFFAGLLGVGGGAIMVPMLTTLFAAQGFPREHLVHVALGTSMAGTAYVAVQMILNVKPKPSRELPGVLGLAGVGAGIGGISAMVAIGGGSLSVPFMTWCNVKIQHAIGTSAAIGLPIAVAGALGYLINGWGAPELPEFTVGFIYLPALVLVSAMSSLTAPIGARLAHRLPVAVLKKVFAGVLIVLSAKMLHTLMAG